MVRELDHGWRDLALGHMAHRLALDVDQLRVRLQLHLVARAVLGLVQHAELCEQLHVLLVEHVRCGVDQRLQVQQPAAFSLVDPLVGVAVAVEDDARMFGQRGAHPAVGGLVEVGGAFHGLAEALQRLRHDRVQDRVRVGQVHLRARHAELELVAGERKRAGAVAVGVVALEARQHFHAEVHVHRVGAVVVFAGDDGVDHAAELVAEEDGDDRRRCLVRAEAMVVAGGRDRDAQQVLVVVDRLHDRGEEHEESQVARRRLARVEQVLGVGRDRPVVVLARAVDAFEGLLVLQADEAVVRGDRAHELHRQQVVVDRHVRNREHRRELVLARRHFVVLGLGRHAELPQRLVKLLHEVVHRGADGAEVVLFHLLALAWWRAEQRAAGQDEVLTLLVVFLLDQEVLLLGADGGGHARDVLAEEREHAARLLGDGLHRAQKRRFLVERFAGVRAERGRDAENLVFDERVARRVPRGVAARFERGADAAGREAAGVGLALDERLAGERHDGAPVGLRIEEGVVLLARDARKRLEPVRVMRGAICNRPFLHGVRHHVGNLDVERLALLDRLRKRLVRCRRQQLLHRVVVEHERAVFLSDSSHVMPLSR